VGNSCTHSKDFEKLDHKNAIKHENRGPPPTFSHNPQFPTSKEIENDCASMSYPLPPRSCVTIIKNGKKHPRFENIKCQK
jgi:hypothetical protein